MKLNETIVSHAVIIEANRESLPKGVLCRLSYPVCNIGALNGNGRVYERAVWERVLADEAIMDKIGRRALFGQAEHPADIASDLQLTSHVIHDMSIDEDGWMHQVFDVLDTPAGRIIDCMLQAGCDVGVSTRAEGDLEEAQDEKLGSYMRVIPESYRYVTTDFTADPSTYGAVAEDVKRNIVQSVRTELAREGLKSEERKFASMILEKIEHPVEAQTLESLFRSGALKINDKVQYDGKEAEIVGTSFGGITSINTKKVSGDVKVFEGVMISYDNEDAAEAITVTIDGAASASVITDTGVISIIPVPHDPIPEPVNGDESVIADDVPLDDYDEVAKEPDEDEKKKEVEESKLVEKNKFMIHFRGAPYSNEFYDTKGREVFDLETAKEEASVLYPNDQYELYNGDEGFITPGWDDYEEVEESKIKETSDVISKKWNSVKAGHKEIFSDEQLDDLEKFIPADGEDADLYKSFVTVPNEGQIGTKDRYIGYIKSVHESLSKDIDTKIDNAVLLAEKQTALDAYDTVVAQHKGLSMQVKMLTRKMKESRVSCTPAEWKALCTRLSETKAQYDKSAAELNALKTEFTGRLRETIDGVKKMKEVFAANVRKMQESFAAELKKITAEKDKLAEQNKADVQKAEKKLSDVITNLLTEYIDVRISEGISISDNMRTLLATCTSISQVDEILQEHRSARKLNALHSGITEAIITERRKPADPEMEAINEKVGRVFDGMGMKVS